ncbi:PilN domain-containing protein [Acetobacter estunensis]|uniref:PilN domain-containing protein n=1 Tax=Acetobacter estunensis TaxID=104097 RepID=UPI001C2D8632|nr:PilN domain-containing protein [Acetobacter estunensis]MBV1836753.1 PilN domain-containing protein [Acetobacter estunensis]
MSGFVRWWLDRMAEILPAAFLCRSRKDMRLTVAQDGTVDLHAVNTLRNELPKQGSRWLPTPRTPDISLVLPAGSILSRDVPLPRAAAANAASTIGYDLDRLTPFREDDVVWSVQRKPGTERGEQIIYRLLVAPRFLFAPALDTLRHVGLTPTRLCADTDDAMQDVIPLGRAVAARHPARRVLCCALIALIALPFVLQQITLFRLDRALAALNEGKEQADVLRHRIAAFTAGPAAVNREEHRIGSPLRTIRTLTEALPDGTFLTGLHIHEHRVTLEGQSAQATQLIGILEHTAAFTDATFSGPVTRAENKQQDVFTITANAPS